MYASNHGEDETYAKHDVSSQCTSQSKGMIISSRKHITNCVKKTTDDGDESKHSRKERESESTQNNKEYLRSPIFYEVIVSSLSISKAQPVLITKLVRIFTLTHIWISSFRDSDTRHFVMFLVKVLGHEFLREYLTS